MSHSWNKVEDQECILENTIKKNEWMNRWIDERLAYKWNKVKRGIINHE